MLWVVSFALTLAVFGYIFVNFGSQVKADCVTAILHNNWAELRAVGTRGGGGGRHCHIWAL